MNPWLIAFLAALVGIVAGYIVRAFIGRWQADAIEKQAQEKLSTAESEASRRLREADIQARAEVVQAREAFEQSTKARRKELQDIDDRLVIREENIERKLQVVEGKEQAAKERAAELDKTDAELNARKAALDAKFAECDLRLQRVAGMTREEARADLKDKVAESVRAEAGSLVRRLHEEAQENARRDATLLVANAIERYAAPHAADSMTSAVYLPNEDIKGRIVGREGRNILAIEAATGTTLIIDGPPGAILVSGFSPIRREVARIALTALVADGRIHPASIEEAVRKAEQEIDESILQAGREAAFAAKQQNLAPEIVKALGALKFRTSYSQNVLAHSLEVSAIMGQLADEMGLDGNLARRIGLLHDIGKSTSEEAEGGHAKIGADMLRRCHEDPVVVNAVASHHREVEQTSVYAVLCSAADAISAARPGARNESLSVYVHRLEKLEAIARERKGVKSAFAIQSGHELRIIVDPEVMNDNDAMLLAQDVSRTIEKELRYPGQIRVVVIREQRCVEYAK